MPSIDKPTRQVRAACAAGRVDEALAIYDDIDVVATQSAPE
jgi:hypothetical protein